MSGATHIVSELDSSEIVLSECKGLFRWSFMPSNNGSQYNIDIKCSEKLSNLPKFTQLIQLAQCETCALDPDSQPDS